MKTGGIMRKALSAVASAAALAMVGLLGMWSGVPWLFPSLGPTIAIQTGSPDHPDSRAWNVIAGHMAGLAAGFAAVYVTGAASLPSVVQAHALSGPRVAAAVLAVLVSMLVQRAIRARHPPAEATTLLIALGALEATLHTALTVACGVVLIAVLGELFRLTFVRQRPE